MNYSLIKYNKKVPYGTCLRENEHLFRCRAQLNVRAKIVRNRDAQCNSEESQLDYELEIFHLCPGLNASIF